RLPEARDTAIRSTSALLPVDLAPARDGDWQWQSQLALDGDNPRFVVFSGEDSSWNTFLSTDAKRLAERAEQLADEFGPIEFGMANARFDGRVYRFDQRQQDPWQLTITSPHPFESRGFVLASSDSPWQLVSWQQSRRHWPGERLVFFADSENADPRSGQNAPLQSALLRVTGPDGRVFESSMRQGSSDVSALGIGSASGAAYSGSFVPDAAGDYTVQVEAHGLTPEGRPFVRTAEHAIAVIDNPLSLSRSSAARAHAIDDTRIAIDLGIESHQADGFVRAYAEVWGHIGKQAVPVAWIGGMVSARTPELTLDGRWIALSGAGEPFELRNVRIEDADHFTPLVQAEHLPMSIEHLPAAAKRAPDRIDEAMRMGPRPDGLSEQKAGARLLLVHGYCSGDVWGPVAGQFTGDSRFLDLNQNRSHNQFALNILSFGQQFSSYGIVAHSQGGAAATHLYTYYWSGLDSASPGRLIQSVGTPYQGTALAGNLAAIGDVFGIGCGTNTDLTYSGAASWLSGVPSWARAAVNYYTTSFDWVWWRYDYCNIGSDLLLKDPEDGTTERTYGQLPGAVNRGHKTGWCHTSGMRDPAQVTDSSRNSVMNANAAR
ncbi:MAG: conditioned medium factor, partial [Xanthomonadaceae bacterium]|nr:conditioned medium factor [Xanthomonadaceae bacterium]